MKPEKPKLLGFKQIYYNLDKILFLFFLTFLLIEFVWLPLNSWLAGLLLRQSGYLFLSYNNIFAIIKGSPLISLGLLILVIINLLVAYFQMGLLLTGARHLLYHEKRTLLEYSHKVFGQSFMIMKEITISKMTFIFFYVMMLFPFIRKILKIYYLNKIVIPKFVVSYVEERYWLVGIIVILLSLIMFYVSVRLMFAIPQLLFEKKTVRQAVSYSIEKTRRQNWFYTWNLLWIVIKTYLFFFLLLVPVILSQTLMDVLTQRESLVLGIINYVLIRNFHYMVLTYFLIKFVSLLTGEGLEIIPRRKKDHWMRWGVLGCACIIFSIEGYVYLEAPVAHKPLVISHRGVSNKNGVQNTVQSLEKTAQLEPDFVETDVQETKDGQFVMMHDANIWDLTGVNASSQDLTLEELTKLDISENGYQSKVTSFDEYLKRANELHQKLLIEIKTSKKDKPDMMKRFLEKYGETLKQNGHQIQSLDYHIIDQVQSIVPEIPAYFILPYNSIFPRTNATGYTMEYSTLDENFVNKLWNTDQKLYVWTINSSDSFDKSIHLGVDGMITDNIELVQELVTIAQEDPDYTDLLLKRALEFFNF